MENNTWNERMEPHYWIPQLDDETFHSAIEMMSYTPGGVGVSEEPRTVYAAASTQQPLTHISQNVAYAGANAAVTNYGNFRGFENGEQGVLALGTVNGADVGVMPSRNGNIRGGSVAQVGGRALGEVNSADNGTKSSKSDKVSRVNPNQAETQRRYRERKKRKVEELEKTVAELQAKLDEVQSQGQMREQILTQNLTRQEMLELQLANLMQKARALSSVSSNPGSSEEATTIKDNATSFLSTTVSGSPTLVTSTDSVYGDKKVSHLLRPNTNATRVIKISTGGNTLPGIEIDDMMSVLETYDNADADAAVRCDVGAILAAAVADKISGRTESKIKMRSYTEAELWYGEMIDVYNLSVQKISKLFTLGASDDDLRSAIEDLIGVVDDTRKSREDLTLVTTAQANLQYMSDNGHPICSICKTSRKLLSKSIVDASLMQSDCEALAERIEKHLAPMEVAALIEWADDYYKKLCDEIYTPRSEMNEKFHEARTGVVMLARSRPEVHEKNFLNVPTKELIAEREGLVADLSRGLMASMNKEIILHNKSRRELLLERLMPRTSAMLIVQSFPLAPDPLSLAFALKKRLERRSNSPGTMS